MNIGNEKSRIGVASRAFINTRRFTCVVFLLSATQAFSQSNDSLRNYYEVRPIEATLNSLIDRVETISGKRVCLNAPANDAEISNAEKILNIEFPENLRILYKLANGQRNAGECASILWDGARFMSIEEVIRQWVLMKELWEIQDDFKIDYGVQGAVQGYHWMPEWVPVGDFGSGDLYCVDFAPSDEGVVGQIIDFIHDDTTRGQVSSDINSFLGSMDDALRRDAASYALGYGVRIKR